MLEPELQFTTEGDISGSIAKFTKLPTSSLLTQYIHAPENWLVEVVRSVYDLDNIKLDNVAIGVHRYENRNTIQSFSFNFTDFYMYIVLVNLNWNICCSKAIVSKQ